MNSIYELMLKLPASISVTIGCAAKMPVIYSFPETIHSLQLAFYWWRDADLYLQKESGVVLPVEGVLPQQTVIPTMIGVKEKMAFIQSELLELAEGAQKYLQETALPPVVQYKVEQGYNKVMEALYANEISKSSYDEFTRQTGRKSND